MYILTQCWVSSLFVPHLDLLVACPHGQECLVQNCRQFLTDPETGLKNLAEDHEKDSELSVVVIVIVFKQHNTKL